MNFEDNVKHIENRVFIAAHEFMNIRNRESSNAFHKVAVAELVRLGQKINALHRISESDRKEAVDALIEFSWNVHTAALILEHSMSSFANHSELIDPIIKELVYLRRNL